MVSCITRLLTHNNGLVENCIFKKIEDPVENRCNATFEIFSSNCVLYLRNVYLLPGLHPQKSFISLRFVQ